MFRPVGSPFHTLSTLAFLLLGFETIKEAESWEKALQVRTRWYY